MEFFGNQDGSQADRISGAGVRKPRSGSVRKPRIAGPCAKLQDSDSPVEANSLDLNHRENEHLSGQLADDMRLPSGDCPLQPIVGSASLSGGASYTYNMDDGNSRTEWKMFQRRDKKKQEEKSDDKDAGKIGGREWNVLDSGFSSKASGKDEGKSPDHERMKQSSRLWKEKDSVERHNKDVCYSDKSDGGSKGTWTKDKMSLSWHKVRSGHLSKDQNRKEKMDFVSKDRGFKNRDDDRPQRDWGSKESSHDREHRKMKKHSDSREITWKSKNTLFRGDSQSGSLKAGQGYNYAMMPKGSGGDHVSQRGLHQSRGQESQSGHNVYGRNAYGANVASSSPVVYERKYSAERNSGDGHQSTKLKLKVGVPIQSPLEGPKRVSLEGGWTIGNLGMTKKRNPKAAPEAHSRRQRLILQDDSDDDDDALLSTKSKDDSSVSYVADEPSNDKCEVYKESSFAGMNHQRLSADADNNSMQGVRKSSRVPKKRVFDNDDDMELESTGKRKKKVEVDSDEDLYQIEEDEVDDEPIDDDVDDDDVDAEVPGSDDKLKAKRKRKKKLEQDVGFGEIKRGFRGDRKSPVPSDSRNGVPLTARQKALQSSKEGLPVVGSSVVDFLDGLSASAPKKQKEVLTAAERQLKKEEAAQKRRQQAEKNAKETQAMAIQKILGQDSQRKKREEKTQKLREEIEQEKKAAAMAPASNSIRWVFGSSGNVVSFSQDLELPKIFSGPISYPQERERCAGPSCTNAYKYRDYKTRLPLCSLQCYRAIQKPSEGTCIK